MMAGMWRFIGWVLVGLAIAASACAGSGGSGNDGAEGTDASSATIGSELETIGSESETLASAGDDAAPETATTLAPTEAAAEEETAEATEPSSDVDLTGCAVPPPPGFPDAEQFSLVNEEDLFRCFRTDSFVFAATFRSEISAPDQLSTIDFVSSSIEVDGERRYQATGTADDLDFDLIRLGNLIYVDQGGEQIELDLDNEASAFQLLGLDSTAAQLTLAGVGLLVVELYGGGAEQVGEEQVGNRTAIRWEADGDAIAERVNGLGQLPGQVAVERAELIIWTDEFGQVMKVKADLPADGVTVGGVPAAQIAGAEDAGFLFGFVYEIEYNMFGEPVTIEAP